MSLTVKAKVIVCIPVWGTQYIERYIAFNLPCFMAQGNLLNMGGDCPYDIEFHYYTDKPGKERLLNHPDIKGLQNDVTVTCELIHELPEEAAADDGASKYDVMASAYEHSLKKAKPGRDIFISLTSDTLYARNVFRNMLRLFEEGKKVVFCGSLRVQENPVLSSISRFKTESAIDIEGGELLDIALDHLHPSVGMSNRWSNNFNIGWPSYLYWILPGKGVLQRGIHLHPMAFRVLEGQSFNGKPSDSSSLSSLYSSEDAAVLSDGCQHCMLSLTSEEEFSDHQFYQLYSPIDIALWMRENAQALQVESLKYPVRYTRPEHACSKEWQRLEKGSQHDVDKILALYDLLKMYPDVTADFAISWRPWESRRLSYGAEWMQSIPPKVNALLAEINKPIVVYGAGEHSDVLWRCTEIARYAVAVSDSDTAKQGQSFEGLPCVAPEDIPRYADTVLISSQGAEQAIKQALKKQFGDQLNIYTLYEVEADKAVG